MTANRRRTVSRRRALAAGLAVPAAGVLSGLSTAVTRARGTETRPEGGPAVRTRPSGRIVVVGAGAFGGWTALWLRRQGRDVTLVDTWGPGNARASSGGDTRVIRHAYDNRLYVDLVSRSLALWRDSERRWRRSLLHVTGMVWLVHDDEAYEKAALKHLQAAGIEHDVLLPADVERRWPAVRVDDIRWALWEENAGYLLARRACEAVLAAFRADGGRYVQARAVPQAVAAGEMPGVVLDGGRTLAADQVVFACGAWLGEMFPDVVGDRVRPTRQDVFTFGPPAGDGHHDEAALPVWADHDERFWYGIPGSERRGFKVADDTRGASFDPTSGERLLDAAALGRARAFMESRFPGMRGAPLLESRVCAYENTADGHYILDRHPQAANAWILGGGSGHGFKNGPAFGEQAAETVLGRRAREPLFSLARTGSGGKAGTPETAATPDDA